MKPVWTANPFSVFPGFNQLQTLSVLETESPDSIVIDYEGFVTVYITSPSFVVVAVIFDFYFVEFVAVVAVFVIDVGAVVNEISFRVDDMLSIVRNLLFRVCCWNRWIMFDPFFTGSCDSKEKC